MWTRKFTSFRRPISLKLFKCFSNLSERDLSKLIRKSLDSYTDVTFEPYRLDTFALGTNFSNAQISIQVLRNHIGEATDPYIINNKMTVYTNTVDFKSLFEKGFDALEQNAMDGKMTSNPNINLAVQTLRTGFLHDKDFHESCLEKIFTSEDCDENDELYVTVLLANHLLASLTGIIPEMSNFGHNYFVSNDFKSKDTYNKCPCEMCGVTIPYKNCGIGSELLWYGYPDIMVYSVQGHCNIVRPRENTDRDEIMAEGDRYIDADFDEKQIIENKKQEDLLRHRRNISQCVAQAITFSLFQKLFQLKKGENVTPVSLIPTIALSGTHFDIYLYDFENDILLRNKGPPIPLWDRQFPETELSMSSVLQIWMVLNHLSLHPVIPKENIEDFRGSCNFLHLLPEKYLELIWKTLKMRKRFFPGHFKEMEAISLTHKKFLKPNTEE